MPLAFDLGDPSTQVGLVIALAVAFPLLQAAYSRGVSRARWKGQHADGHVGDLAQRWMSHGAELVARRVSPPPPRPGPAANGSTSAALLIDRARLAAQASDRNATRELLLQTLELDPTNEEALLWLAGLTTDRTEAERILRTVLAINPTNQRARAALRDRQQAPLGGTPIVRREDTLVASGQRAARQGDVTAAREAFLQALELDSRDEEAWLWLAATCDEPSEVRRCLQTVVQLNPHNQRARLGLIQIGSESATQTEQGTPASRVAGARPAGLQAGGVQPAH
jgi:tetratricopeptide (TPR) repeat protein